MKQFGKLNRAMEAENHLKNGICLKTKALFLVVIMSFTAINMMAETWKVGDNVTATLSGDTMTIRGEGSMTYYYSYSEQYRPYYNSRLNVKSLIIEEGVTIITSYAFNGFSNLTSVTIPNSVWSIGEYAFSGCSSLTSIIIPNTVRYIYGYAFRGCSKLKNLVIEDGSSVLSFWTYELTDRYTKIYGTFENCPIETVYLGRTIDLVRSDSSPFNFKKSLTSLTIGNDVTEISGFWGCSGLVSITCKATVPPTFRKPGFTGEQTAFYDVSSATKIIIPCQTLSVYQNSNWNKFTNFTEDNDCSGVSQLSSLTTSIGKLEFAPDVYSYELIVHKNINKITLTATAAYGGTVSGVGEKTLQFGKNDFPVTVHSENGETNKIYTVSVIRRSEEYWMDLTNSETIYGTGVTREKQDVDGHRLTYNLYTGNHTGNIHLQFNLDGKNGNVATSKIIENVQANSVYQIAFTIYSLKDKYIDFDTYIPAGGYYVYSRNYLYYDFIASDKTGENYPTQNPVKIIGIPTSIDDIKVSYVGFAGINSYGKKTISIYPNPAVDFITISGLQNYETLDFYTVDGQLLFTHKATKEIEYISISHLQTGMYFVKTSNGQTLKWIKR